MIKLLEENGKKYEVGVGFTDGCYQYFPNIVKVYKSTIHTFPGVKRTYDLEDHNGKVTSVNRDMVECMDYYEQTWG